MEIYFIDYLFFSTLNAYVQKRLNRKCTMYLHYIDKIETGNVCVIALMKSRPNNDLSLIILLTTC